MEAARALMEHCWIDKKEDKELYARVRKGLSGCQKFFREQLGWTIIHNERILKLEKIPAHAESYMGITEFTEIRDYCMFCAVLIFLEDKEDQEQFLLSELVDVLELQLKEVLPVDWTKFTHRKSLVRVLQFCEGTGLVEVYEGKSEGLGSGMGQEVLYENTGLSRYMAVNFSHGLTEIQSWKDFEREPADGDGTDRGHYRINRVYRQLAAAPALYWDRADDPDGIYLKNQRQWIRKNLNDHLGGQLHVHKNAAFFVMEEDCFGERHPREAMLPELVLIFCQTIREKAENGVWERRADERIPVPWEEFKQTLLTCREETGAAWSKEYREMEEEKLAAAVLSYMKGWMMLEEAGEQLLICPAAGKAVGRYPEDFQTKENKHE